MSYIWSPEKVSEATSLREAGLSNHQIAVKMGITSDAVRCRLKRLASGVSGGSVKQPAQAQRPPEVIFPLDRPLPDTGSLCRSEAPAVHTQSRTSTGNYLVIPDPQIPFHKRDAVQFVERVRRAFSVPRENMACAGDEVDAYFGSRFDHSPDASHTPNSEIEAALGELRRWYAMWPHMRLANSNHGQRWVKKALGAQIPSQLMRAYREVLQAPEGWRWADSWRFEGKKPWMLEHGHNGPQGFLGIRTRPLQNGISTVWGHQHANAGIAHVVTSGQQVFGMCVGSLIDTEQYAFEYDRANQYRPWIGVGVILDGGTTPVLIPYER